MDKKKLAVIHIVKKELNLNNTDYRNILRRVTGVESAADLNNEKFKKLMNFFVRSSYYRVNRFGLTIRQKLFIKYLAAKINWDQEHLNNFIKKYFHKSGINTIDKKVAIKVIESLKAILQHKK